ncbi:MAG: site-2 protease family protein, partial [Deltaproteobacteria bacterium]|nr:site-2 protease family protein [Candidatus Tharpellaceae bacterium]
YVADFFGDHTARDAGRLTLNPLKHLDLFGTAVFFITRIIGWAKPVPINPNNLANPRQNMLWIAAAGPAANMLLAIISAIIYHLLTFVPMSFMGPLIVSKVILPLTMMVKVSVIINLALGFFNLIPIPPLDGSKILSNLLPPRPSMLMARIEPYGFIILMLLVFSNAINLFIIPVISFFSQMMIGVGLG